MFGDLKEPIEENLFRIDLKFGCGPEKPAYYGWGRTVEVFQKKQFNKLDLKVVKA